MEIAGEQQGAVFLIKMSGRLEFQDIGALREFFNQRLHQTPRQSAGRYVVFDLTETEYMSSVCLGCMLNVVKEIRATGGDARLAAPNSDLRCLFDVVNLVRTLAIHDSVETAIEELESCATESN